LFLEKFRDEFAKGDSLDRIEALFLDEKKDNSVRLSAGRLYAALSTSGTKANLDCFVSLICRSLISVDLIVPRMYAQLDLFVRLLLKDPSKEVQQIAALTLGNLARSDAKVAEMTEKGVAKALVDVVSDTTRDLSVRHYSISCLRNIALLDQNKVRSIMLND